MRTYLATRYRRREETRRRAEELVVLGHHVTARWVRSSHILLKPEGRACGRCLFTPTVYTGSGTVHTL